MQPGDFFALLGPNGAGKSTLIGIVSSLVNASSGSVKVFGIDIGTQREAAMRLLGLVPQEVNFNFFEKPFDILCNYAGFYGVARTEARRRAEEELRRAQLWEKAFTTARTLSGGGGRSTRPTPCPRPLARGAPTGAPDGRPGVARPGHGGVVDVGPVMLDRVGVVLRCRTVDN